jgi:peroxiredoxin
MVELGEFAKHNREFQDAGVQVLAVSTDPMSRARWTAEKVKTPFPVLSDTNRVVMKLYGTRSLSTYPSPDGGPYNHATLLLIDKQGIIRWIYRNPDYRVRSSWAQDLAQAKKLE